MNNKNAFYLKINRTDYLSIKNLERWIDAAYLSNADCYIVCDKKELIKRIEEYLFIVPNVVYMESIKSDEARYLVKNVISENWENAAYAHLTTLIHANKMQYEYFWNIDADDTVILLSDERIQELLKCVERYAKEKELDAFSLDMHKSKKNLWTLGIAYMNGKIDWLKIMTQFCKNSEYKEISKDRVINIDAYIECLKKINVLKAESYYFENLKFIHFLPQNNIMFVGSWLHHWKDGKLTLPIISDFLGFNELACYNIPEDVIKFDIKIDDNEAKDILSYYSWDRKGYGLMGNWKNVVNEDICKEKLEIFLERHAGALKNNKNMQIVCFGAGEIFHFYYDKVNYFFDIKYICDNDSKKWGNLFEDAAICISPEQLRNMDDVFVIITVRVDWVNEIKEQLKAMGINNYASVYSLCRCLNKMHEIHV